MVLVSTLFETPVGPPSGHMSGGQLDIRVRSLEWWSGWDFDVDIMRIDLKP